MRLVNRRLMLQQPVNTVYSMWVPNAHVELFVFMGAVDAENFTSSPLMANANLSFFLSTKFMKSIPRYRPEPGDTRSQLYLIWEADDVNTLLARMVAAQASLPFQVEQTMGD